MSGIIVHEWLAPAGGSENVFHAIADAFPDAERWCLWKETNRFDPVNESFLARTPLTANKALAVPFMPAAWRALPRREAEWVLASSHLFAHHARFRGPAYDAPKLVYAHTPARYIWAPELDARGDNLPARVVSRILKPIDRKRAQEPVAIAANSKFVADRIARTWERNAEVIYPNVDVERFMKEPRLSEADKHELDRLPDHFILGFSRFVPYKRLDAAIDAGHLSGLPVVLAGGGHGESELRAYAQEMHPGQVHFSINPSDELITAILRRATILVFAPVEDFGIVPVEAMAAGTPAVVSAQGGAVESVLDGLTGAHVVDWDDPDHLRSCIERALSCREQDCVRRAQDFSSKIFTEKIRNFVFKSI